jgi:hypothetical protein
MSVMESTNKFLRSKMAVVLIIIILLAAAGVVAWPADLSPALGQVSKPPTAALRYWR